MKHILIILLLMLPLCAKGQTRQITSTVVDNETRPVEFANVILLSADSAFIKGCVTGADGKFSLVDNTDKGKLVKISMLGYETKVIRLPLPDTIRLVEKASSIKETVVKASRRYVKPTSRGISIDIDNSPLATLGDAENCIRQLPLIDTSTGAISVLGKGTPLIYIDKRLVRNDSELKSLQSGDIKDIEILTNPPARYGAEVTSVILITTKHRHSGLAVDASTGVTASEEWSERGELNIAHTGKSGLTVFGNLAYAWDGFKQNRYYNELFGGGDNYSDTHAEARSRSQALTADGGFNYDFGKNSIGAKYTFTRTPESNYNATAVSSTNSRGSLSDISSLNKLRSSAFRHALNGFADLSILKNTSLRLDADYLKGRSVSSSNTDEEEADNLIANRNNTDYSLLASKVELGTKLNNIDASIGAEASHTENNQNFASQSNVSAGFLADSRDDVAQSLYGSWASFDWNLSSRWNIYGGLRYEHVSVSYEKNNVRVAGMSPTYSNLFPNVGITYKSVARVSLYYKGETSRPNYSLLDNNYVYVTPTLWETGNPALRSAVYHKLGIDFSYSKFILQTTLTQRHRTHASVYFHDGSNGVNIRQEQTLPDYTSFQAVAVQQFDLGLWHPTLQGLFYVQNLKYGEPRRSYSCPLWQIVMNNRLSLPAGINAYINFMVLGKGNQDVLYSRGSWQTSITLNKQVGRWTFTLTANDIAGSWRQTFLVKTNDVEYATKIKGASRFVGLTVKYNFNTTRKHYKGKAASQDEIDRL